MESRPFNSDAHETSDWDDDDDESPRFNASKKVNPAAVADHVATHDSPTTPALFGAQKSEKPKAQTSTETLIFGETNASAEKANMPEDDEDGPEDIENLSPDEAALVVQEYVFERTEVVDIELEQSTPDGPAAAAATADKTLLQNLEAHIAAGGETEGSVDAALEAALQQTAQDLELPISDVELTPTASTDPANLTEQQGASRSSEDDDTDLAHTGSTATIAATQVNSTSTASGARTSSGSSSGSGLPSARTSSSTPATPPAPAASGAGSRATPTGSGGGTPPGSSPISVGGGVPPSAGPNTLNTAPQPPDAHFNVTPVVTPETTNQSARSRSDFAKGLLVGGVAGYLIGRRRGRIKTEQKFTAVTEKLQKEVTTLQDKVLQKEQQVRRLAAEKAIAEQATPVPVAQKVENVAQPISTTAETATIAPAVTAERPKAETTIAEAPSTANTAEKTSDSATKQAPEKPPLTPKAVEHLPKNELLDVAATITIEGATLKKLYESGSLDEKALRRVVSEHIRTGGHAERQLKAEIAHAQQKASPENVGTKPAVGRRQAQGQSRSSSTSPGSHQGIWESSIAITATQPDQNWRADAAIDQHINKTLPRPRSKPVGGFIGGTVLLLIIAAIWYFVTN